jgi:2'-5' RNA ligase
VAGAATARLFVAIDPPAPLRAELAAWARAALGPNRGDGGGASRPLRVLDPRLLHLTLCFLGARPLEEVESIAAALEECAQPVGGLSIGAPLWLPPRRPRALAVEVHDPDAQLARLQRCVSDAVAQATGRLGEDDDAARGVALHRGGRGVSSHRRRGFLPHITLARMREGVAPRARELPPTPALAFTPTEVVLYRSWLDPQGASYEALARATLAPAGFS